MFFFTVPVHRQDERARADEFQAALERSEFQYQQMMDEYSQLEMAADPSAMRMMKQAMQDCDDQIAKLQRDLDKKELEVEKLHEQVSPTGSRRFRRIKFPIVSFLFFLVVRGEIGPGTDDRPAGRRAHRIATGPGGVGASGARQRRRAGRSGAPNRAARRPTGPAPAGGRSTAHQSHETRSHQSQSIPTFYCSFFSAAPVFFPLFFLESAEPLSSRTQTQINGFRSVLFILFFLCFDSYRKAKAAWS